MWADDSSPQARLPRVRFESDGAAVQFALTDVIMHLQRAFDEATLAGCWRDEDTEIAHGLADRFQCLTGSWMALVPPEPLREDWEEVTAGLQAFGPLFDRLDSLEGKARGPLAVALSGLQRDFTAEMEKLNAIERTLVSREIELSQS